MKRTKRFLLSLLTLLCCCTGAWATGELNGLFTINASGDKVQFSQGNLQYFCSTSAPEWRFAEHQYDYVTFDISAYAANSEKWIDLFAHGTSGYNNEQANYQPYVVGAASNTYYQGNLTGNADWGYNAISNGGNTENIGWRTLTRDEWLYVFSGRSNAASKYGHGSINGTNGMILLPDSWTLPDGLSFTSGNSAWTNSYTLEQWSLMENAGAVFLPASGSCNSAGIPSESTQNQNGFYRASTAAYYMYFGQSVLQNCSMSFYEYGDAVRLVKDYTLQQDGEGNYLLGSAYDWKLFATLVNGGNTTAKAKMTADIDLGDDQTTIGSGNTNAEYANVVFKGVFDGNGHTLTVNYNTSEGFYAPIRHISGATIKNLHVTGSIVSSGGRVGGIVCGVFGGSSIHSKIEKCRSSVVITSNCQVPVSDAESVGGIVGQVGFKSNLSLEDCIFDGEITGHVSNVIWSGLVGVLDGTVNTTRCLQAGSFNDLNNGTTANSATIVCRWQNAATSIVTMDATYYIHSFKTVQGTQATSADLADGTITAALQNGRAEEVWVQDLVTNQPMLKMFASLWQDGEETYCIGSDAGWTAFANGINDGTIAINANAKLMADIDLGDDQTMVGTISVPYQGEFDGQGHTLTVNYNMRNDITGVAPFACVGDATIQNLHVAGSVIQQNIGAGGIVAQIKGNLTMKRCWVSAYVNAAIGTVAGIAGYCDYEEVYNKTILLEDCLFSGHIDQGYYSGGLMSHIHGSDGYNNSAQFNNCLNVGTCNNPSGSTGTFARTGTQGDPYTITNCYYKIAWRVAQGTQASTAQLADGTTAYKLQNNRGDMVWGQRIGTDAMPVLTNDENYRVYRSKTGGYTNNPEEAYEGIQQDGEGNYLLGSLPDWQVFAEIVNSGTNAAANAKMTADIDLGDDQTHIGSVTEGATPYYAGIFDGQGHTLTVNYVGGSDQIVAPFTQISSATIKNLHVAGSIQSSFAYIGVVGKAGSGSVISNVWMSATMNTTQDGWVQSAAIAGYCDGSIQDCLFTGTYTSNGGGYMGGFYGYTNASPTITNCLSTGTFSQGNWQGNGVHTNCYLKQYPADLTTGCSWATNETLSDGTIATALQNSRAEEVWVQDPMTNQPMLKIFANAAYTVPSSGIGTFSAKAKFAVPDGLTAHYCKAYDAEKGTISVVAIEGAVPANTGVILKGEPGETYTLTGTNDDAATVTDNALVAVTEATHVDPTSGLYTNFMMKSGKFIRIGESDESVKMSANKAYLQILTSALPSDPAQARDIVLSWDEEDPTGINEVRGEKEDVRGEIYNLSGQRVSKPTKGLYIIGGKKVFIP